MVLADVRPDAVDLLLRAGNTVTVTLEWPTGSLAGRSFTSTLDGQALALSVVDDTMTIVADDLLTGALTTPVEWLLLEDIEGTDEPALIGTWTPSNSPRAVDSATVTVTEGAATVTVSPASAQASIVALENKFFTPHVSRPAAWGERWLTARDEADSRLVSVHIWGGSVSDGQAASDRLTTSWAGIVENTLRDTYGHGGTGFWTRARNTTQSGGWADSPGFGSVQSVVSGAASIRWENIQGTTVKLYHRDRDITGSFRWRIDGGAWMNVTPPTTLIGEPGVQTVTGLADVLHSVDVEWVSGTVGIHGVSGTRETGVVIHRCTIGGRAYSEWGRIVLDQFSVNLTDTDATVTCASPGFFTSKMVGKYLYTTTADRLPFNARVSSVTSATSLELDNPALATAAVTVWLTSNRPSDAAVPQLMANPTAFSEGLGQPDLLILGANLNDAIYVGAPGATGPNSPSADLARNGMSSLLRGYYKHHGAAYAFTPDLLVVGEHLGNSFQDNANWNVGAQVAAQFKDQALGMGGAHIDIWGLGKRSWQFWEDQEPTTFWADAFFHPSDAGHAAMADPVVALLTS